MHIDSAKGHDFGRVIFVPEEVMSVASYARVVGSSATELRSTAAATKLGYAARPAPAAMLAMYTGIAEDEVISTLGVTYGRTLVVAMEVHSFDADIVETDELELHSRVPDAFVKAGADGAEYEILLLERHFYRSGSADPVCRSMMTMLEPRTPRPPRGPDAGASRTDAPPTDSDHVRRIGPLSRLDFARFSVATDDPNSVHLVDAVAHQAQLDGVIGSGGIALALVTEHLSDLWGRRCVESVRLRMSAPIEVGAQLSSAITAPHPTTAPIPVRVLDEARGGAPIAHGAATVRLPTD